MRLICAFLLTAFTFLPLGAYGQKPQSPLRTLEDARSVLKPLVAKHYPNAVVVARDELFSVKANAMQFTLHRIDRIGRVSRDTYQQEGPEHDGFMLSVTKSQGRYGGPAVVPQTLRRPYWNTLINEIYDAQSDSHLWVVYSFGPQVQRSFHETVLRTFGELPSTRRR